MGRNMDMISPSITLKDIFGPGLVMNSRASSSNCRWISDDPACLDFLTGSPLVIAGDMPVICSDSVITEEVLSLLEMVNLEVTPFRHIYSTEKDYKKLLNLLGYKGVQLVLNHLHPPEEIAHELYWTSPQLLAFLNNKANLDELVPSEHLPKRIKTNPREIDKISSKFMKLPLVIKAATAQPTGAGNAVIICNTCEDLDYASACFRTCEKVVIEEYVEIVNNYNVQFAKTLKGQILYLGASEQITTASGQYLGNWLEKTHEGIQTVVELGRTIMERASRIGFWGIAGFDIVVSKDTRVLAIDLNFRLNGSTPALLLRDSIMRNYGGSVLLFRKWSAGLKWNKFLPVCRDAIESLNLIPLSVYDPQSSPYTISTPFLSGILTGPSREDILKQEHLFSRSIVS